MFTIFTIPKPFRGHIKTIQRNAIKSWIYSQPLSEIVLFGDDYGVEETAKELGLIHIPSIDKNEYGTPLLSSVFEIVQRISKYDTLIYINSDIILLHDLWHIISSIHKELFLICGQRIDLNIKEEINYEKGWIDSLIIKARNEGRLHGYSGIDYFIFQKNSIKMPPFAVGRPGWDGWLIYNFRSRGLPVIDATEAITVIHQNHDYSHSKFGQKKNVIGPERDINTRLAGGAARMMSLRDADWILNKNKLERPRYPRRLFSHLSKFFLWQLLLSFKRNVSVAIDNKKLKVTRIYDKQT